MKTMKGMKEQLDRIDPNLCVRLGVDDVNVSPALRSSIEVGRNARRVG